MCTRASLVEVYNSSVSRSNESFLENLCLLNNSTPRMMLLKLSNDLDTALTFGFHISIQQYATLWSAIYILKMMMSLMIITLMRVSKLLWNITLLLSFWLLKFENCNVCLSRSDVHFKKEKKRKHYANASGFDVVDWWLTFVALVHYKRNCTKGWEGAGW